MIVADFSLRKQWAILEGYLRVLSIKLRTRFIIFFCLPIIVSYFFASVAKEAWLFFAIEVKPFITIEYLINLIDPIVLKRILNQRNKLFKVRKLALNFTLSLLYSC